MYRQAVYNGADMGHILLTLHGYWYGAQLRYAHTPFNTSLVTEETFTNAQWRKVIDMDTHKYKFGHSPKTLEVVLFLSADICQLCKNQVEYLWMVFLGRDSQKRRGK